MNVFCKLVILNILSFFFSSSIWGITPHIDRQEISSKFKWQLIWQDEFKSTDIKSLWIPQNSPTPHTLSSRWEENAVIKSGKLYIYNKKENKGGQEWTSASLTSRNEFDYGYFECRVKIAQSSGINNALWLYSNKNEQGHLFEIDIAEVHYPNLLYTNIHDWGTKQNRYRKQHSRCHPISSNLSKKFHIYGLEWNDKEIKFYFDGKLIRTEKNSYCFDKAQLIIGCAILPWAGNITDKINGTSTIVDYIRYFKRK